jgi:hypothetical protein
VGKTRRTCLILEGNPSQGMLGIIEACGVLNVYLSNEFVDIASLFRKRLINV